MKATEKTDLLVVILIAAVLLAVGMAFIHNHYSDLGSQFDPTCPLCQILMGFILFLVACLAFTFFLLPRWLSRPVPIVESPLAATSIGFTRAPPIF